MNDRVVTIESKDPSAGPSGPPRACPAHQHSVQVDRCSPLRTHLGTDIYTMMMIIIIFIYIAPHIRKYDLFRRLKSNIDKIIVIMKFNNQYNRMFKLYYSSNYI